MRAIQTFDTNDSLAVLRAEWLYTMARLKASLHTAAFIPDFQAVGAKLDTAVALQSR